MNAKIQHLIYNLPEQKLRKVLEVREVILSSLPEIKETVKWGRITFVFKNEPIAFLCLHSKHEYIELGFFKGDLLTDAENLLCGKHKTIKRFAIQMDKPLTSKQIDFWIKEAISKI
jgi:hypothetical protein